MKRHFYVHNDLSEIRNIETKLEAAGISPYQMHVLSEDDAAVDAYKLHSVSSLFRKDVVRTGFIGLGIGILSALAVVLVAMAMNVSDVMWVPTIFLAVILLGFCVWEGGLWGIQSNNKKFERFESELNKGNHVLMVDIKANQEAVLFNAISSVGGLKDAGEGAASPEWLVGAQNSWNKFVHWAP